jgi:hypothetical protein
LAPCHLRTGHRRAGPRRCLRLGPHRRRPAPRRRPAARAAGPPLPGADRVHPSRCQRRGRRLCGGVCATGRPGPAGGWGRRSAGVTSPSHGGPAGRPCFTGGRTILRLMAEAGSLSAALTVAASPARRPLPARRRRRRRRVLRFRVTLAHVRVAYYRDTA